MSLVRATVILDLNGDFLVLNVMWSPLSWTPNCLPVSTLQSVIFLKFCLFLAVLGFHCCMGFSLVAVSRGCSVVPGPGFLTAAASLVEHRGVHLLRLKPLEHRVRSCGAQA